MHEAAPAGPEKEGETGQTNITVRFAFEDYFTHNSPQI